jgi:DNA repair protein RadC
MSIQDWPEDARPREKLIKFGADSLSDAELLAIFLRVGIKGKSAVELSTEIIEYFGSLYNLCQVNLAEFSKIKGLGLAKYSQLHACLEMAKRVLIQDIKSTQLQTAQQLYNYLHLHFNNLCEEHLIGIFLDHKQHILAKEILARGSIDSLPIYTRNIVKFALQHNAKFLILAHNHTNGYAQPSSADIQTTADIKNALAYIEVELIDHIIIAGKHNYSMKQHQLI